MTSSAISRAEGFEARLAGPAHSRPEMLRDYTETLGAGSLAEARVAYDRFVRGWRAECPPVARSIEEAGTELLSFHAFPKPMWRALRSTNTIENLNREFRRRTKTQGSFSTEDAAVALLYGLVAFGQIRMRKIDGHRHVASIGLPGSRNAAQPCYHHAIRRASRFSTGLGAHPERKGRPRSSPAVGRRISS